MISPEAEAETVEVETSLEDDLRAAFDAANATIDNDTGEVVETGTESETEAEKATRERDEHGRFKAKEANEPEPAPEQAPEAETPAQPDPYGLAPQYAGPAIKEKWASLDPEVRAEIVKRDQEVHRTFTRFDEERNFGKGVKEVVAPFEGLIKSLGAEPVQAIKYLLEGDAALRTGTPEQKAAMFHKLARDYGVQLDGLAQQEQQQIDPRVETLNQRIARLEHEQNSVIVQRREEEQNTLNAQIADFASKPEHVYFERVKPVMASLLQNGQADSLEKAYDMAVYADPDTRALHLAAEREAEDRKRTTERTAQAAAARRASPSVQGAPGSTVPAALLNGSASNSVEDDVRAAIQAASGRA